MFGFARGAPQVSVVLAFLILSVSFAWGLPAEPAGAERDAEPAAEDPWAGVKISDAHDYAKCLYCGNKNELRAERCVVCGHELPQPMAELAYPPWVFVPGEGYFREGTLLEPAKTNKTLWITGLGVTALGVVYTANRFDIAVENPGGKHTLEFVAGLSVTAIGVALVIFGFKKSVPVYAFTSDEYDEPFDGRTYGLRSPDADGAALKVEVALLGF
jgi:hypothetical protein